MISHSALRFWRRHKRWRNSRRNIAGPGATASSLSWQPRSADPREKPQKVPPGDPDIANYTHTHIYICIYIYIYVGLLNRQQNPTTSNKIQQNISNILSELSKFMKLTSLFQTWTFLCPTSKVKLLARSELMAWVQPHPARRLELWPFPSND